MSPTRASDRRIYAVLTGDIVGSTKLSPAQMGHVRETLAKCFKTFNTVRNKAIQGSPEFYRGDSWQVLLREPRWALRLAILAQARLAAKTDAHTRVSIGIGFISDTNERKISLKTGEAFTLSGEALDDITSYFRLTGALPERFGTVAPWFPVIMHLCNGLMSSWTRRQAELVAIVLQLSNPTHEAIGASLDITKQSVTDILTSANWRTLLEPIRAFEATNWQSLSIAYSDEAGENASQAPDRQERLPQRKRT